MADHIIRPGEMLAGIQRALSAYGKTGLHQSRAPHEYVKIGLYLLSPVWSNCYKTAVAARASKRAPGRSVNLF